MIRTIARFGCLLVVVVLTGASWPGPPASAQSKTDSALQALPSDPLPQGAERRLGASRLRIPHPIQWLQFTPDDSMLLAGLETNARVLLTTDWKEIRRIPSWSMACSPDGSHYAQLAPKGIIEIRKLKSNDLVQTRNLRAHLPEVHLRYIAFGAKHNVLWFASQDADYLQYDWVADRITLKIKSNDTAYSRLVLSRDRRVLAVRHFGKKSDTIAFYDGESGKRLSEIDLSEHHNWYGLNANGAIFAVRFFTTREISFFLWDVATGKRLDWPPQQLVKSARSVAIFDNDGTHFIAPCTGVIRSLDLRRKTVAAEAPLDANDVSALAVSNDNKRLAVGYESGRIEIRDLATLQPVVDDPHPYGDVSRIAFSPDGSTLAAQYFTLYARKAKVRLWNPRNGAVWRDLNAPLPPQSDELRFSEDYRNRLTLAFFRRGRALALGSSLQWDLETGQQEGVTKRGFRFLSAAENGERVLMAKELPLRRHDQELVDLKVNDLAKVQAPVEIPVSAPAGSWIPVNGVGGRFSPNGDWLALRTQSVVRADPRDVELRPNVELTVWRLNERTPTNVFRRRVDGSLEFAMTRDARLLASFGVPSAEGPNSVFQISTGFPLWRAVADANKSKRYHTWSISGVQYDPGDCLVFSADGQFLAGVAGDVEAREIEVREALSGDLMMTLTGHEGYINGLAFSPDGKQLASASRDSTVLLWTMPPFPSAKAGQWRRDRAEALWNALGGSAAYQAMADLHAGSDDAVAAIKAMIRPEADDERKQMEKDIADLGSPQFRVRDQATSRLGKSNYRVKLLLLDAISKTSDLEAKRRLVSILDRRLDMGLDADERRLNRIVYLLERIGTPAACAVLESIANGPAQDTAADSARSALGRLKRASS